ncbi:hypothetical protein AVEN_171622-1 [Araneus ventricosus]|uniref:Uncharacterized protein n=1 Tax=Araneus ventricosus TaxID=182803 RepID=A0A4Y2EZ71_ARAVE|nr:hypothetical protein AVEN_171622-1 [Araneus ventricosus]
MYVDLLHVTGLFSTLLHHTAGVVKSLENRGWGGPSSGVKCSSASTEPGSKIVKKLQTHPVRDSNPRSSIWQAGTLTTTQQRNTRERDDLINLSFSVTIALVAASSGVKINQGQNTYFKVVEMSNRCD